MPGADRLREVVVFLGMYLVLSVPPFLYLNRDILSEVRLWLTQDVVAVAVVGTLGVIAIAALFLANEGVQRYNNFMFTPTDVLSVVIEVVFVFAAISWWLIPELAARNDIVLSLNELLVVIIICHVPMIVFLSLMTALGKV